jgi:pantoate--beta-alanine ligase
MNETDAIGSVAVLGADGGPIAVARTVAGARAALAGAPRPIGLVPTMGALHDGHLALLARARAENATVVMSLFVNPTQFAEGEDLAAYPRDEARDVALARAAGVDLVFAPPVEEMYPPGFLTSVSVAGLGDTLEGAVRGPEHFQAVATVVAKLLNIIGPQVAYFGQKDAQQALVIARMARDLDMPSAIEVVATVREPDGLARSSRNAYLDPVRRAQAVGLSRALRAAAAAVEAGERRAGAVAQAAHDELARHDLDPDYVAVVDRQTLAPLERIDGPVLVALAARVGPARLIDNLIVSPDAAI